MTERPTGGDRFPRDGAPTDVFPRVRADQGDPPTQPIASGSGPAPAAHQPGPAADGPAQAHADGPGRPDADRPDDTGEPAKLSILEQLGGLSGIVASTIPVVAFVLVNAVTSLIPAVIAAVAVAVGIAVWRIVRKEPLQPAVSGLFGVGVGAFIAYRTGEAKGYFLIGIWYSLVLCVLFVASVLVRWPLAGVVWHGINGDGQGWRREKPLLRAYTLATLLWAAVFAGRFVVQRWLYDSDQTFWLGAARLGMGLPLTGLALLGTVWAVRRAQRYEPAPGTG